MKQPRAAPDTKLPQIKMEWHQVGWSLHPPAGMTELGEFPGNGACLARLRNFLFAASVTLLGLADRVFPERVGARMHSCLELQVPSGREIEGSDPR